MEAFLFFVFKLVACVFAEGFLAMGCLWPINDQPTSKTQWIVFFVLSAIFIGWWFNLFN